MILQELQLLVSDGFVFSIMHEKLTAAELEYSIAGILHNIIYWGHQTCTSFSAQTKKQEKNKKNTW